MAEEPDRSRSQPALPEAEGADRGRSRNDRLGRPARVAPRMAAAVVTVALGAGAALAVAACGEDREGSVENIGGATTGTGGTVAPGSTTSPTTGATDTTSTTESE